jgi:hypothetical protein
MGVREWEGKYQQKTSTSFSQDGDRGERGVGGGEGQSSVGNRYEGVAESRAVSVAVYCDASVLLVTMVSVARLKRLVQGLTLVAVATYTAIVLYQSMSAAASSSRPQVQSTSLVMVLWVTTPSRLP